MIICPYSFPNKLIVVTWATKMTFLMDTLESTSMPIMCKNNNLNEIVSCIGVKSNCKRNYFTYDLFCAICTMLRCMAVAPIDAYVNGCNCLSVPKNRIG